MEHKKHKHEQQDIKENLEKEISSDLHSELDVEEGEAEGDNLVKRIEELENEMLRYGADMDNLRKRTAKELDDTRKYAVSTMVKDLIDTIENLYRAIDSIDKDSLEKDPIAKSIYDGVVMTQNSLMGVMSKHGVQRISPLGEAFNHDHHQAIGHVATSDYPQDYVAQVVQAGYILGDRLLRPALVMVVQ